MKERPIIFSAPMVRAILEGRKTQTRRPMKFQGADAISELEDGSPWPWCPEHEVWVPCPYGEPGDRLWVKEAWRIGAWRENGAHAGCIAVDFRASPEETRTPWVKPEAQVFERLVEQSHFDARTAIAAGKGSTRDEGTEWSHLWRWDRGDSPCRWRSPRFLPRVASRIDLEVTRVRVERLQDISEKDAIAEGIRRGGRLLGATPIEAYSVLWDELHGAGSWAKNRWVWVVEFRRTKP